MGIFITVEGGEYTGKSTVVIPSFRTVLEYAGLSVLVSREPGGSPEAEQLRGEIFEKKRHGAPEKEIAELFFRARAIHLTKTVHPFLGEHKENHGIVLMDRYIDSSRVYQGLEGGLSLKEIHNLERVYTHHYLPDMTYIPSIPTDVFSVYYRARKNMSTPERVHEKPTTWDQSDISVHLKRQSLFEQLPDISARFHETRTFISLDSTRHPYRIVSSMVQAFTDYMSSHKTYGTYHNYLPKLNEAVDMFPSTPCGKDMEERWRLQCEHVRETS